MEKILNLTECIVNDFAANVSKLPLKEALLSSV